MKPTRPREIRRTYPIGGHCGTLAPARGPRARPGPIDMPKAAFWTFRDGKIVEFHELYDTAALIATAKP